jgi:kynurenine formamidase
MVPRERHTRGGTALESRDGQGQALACLFVRMRIRSRSGWPRVLTATTLLLHLLGTQAMAGALERAMLGKSTVVDLTHPIEQGAAGIGGAEGPRPDPNGEKATAGPRSAAGGGLGTRLNVLGLARKTGATVARIPSRELFAQAIVVDVTKKAAEVPGYRVTTEDLLAWEQAHGRIPKQSVVLLSTGWARRWADPTRYVNADAQGVPRVPGFSAAALAFLVNDRSVRGVGLDAFTPDGPPAGGGNGHESSVPAGRWQLENLANLDRLPARGAKLVIAPLRVEASSAPARVLAILP